MYVQWSSAVWEVDATAQGTSAAAGGSGESVAQVAARVDALLNALNTDAKRPLLLVSHGDTLQITQALLTGDVERLRTHRQFAM